MDKEQRKEGSVLGRDFSLRMPLDIPDPVGTQYCAIMNFAYVPTKFNLSERARVFVQNPELDNVGHGTLCNFKDSGISDAAFNVYVSDLIGMGHARNGIWDFKVPQTGVAVFSARQSEIDLFLKRHDGERFFLVTADSKAELNNIVQCALRAKDNNSQPSLYLDA